MPKYEINAPYPGSYIEGFGLLKPGTVIDLPERFVVTDFDGAERVVVIEPRCCWIPLDDVAKSLFKRFNRTPHPKMDTKKKTPAIDDPTLSRSARPPWADDGTPAGFEGKGEKIKMAAAPKRASDT